MAEENEVVDGDHALDAAFADADGKFAGETVVELDTITEKVADYAAAAPIRS